MKLFLLFLVKVLLVFGIERLEGNNLKWGKWFIFLNGESINYNIKKRDKWNV